MSIKYFFQKKTLQTVHIIKPWRMGMGQKHVGTSAIYFLQFCTICFLPGVCVTFIINDSLYYSSQTGSSLLVLMSSKLGSFPTAPFSSSILGVQNSKIKVMGGFICETCILTLLAPNFFFTNTLLIFFKLTHSTYDVSGTILPFSKY